MSEQNANKAGAARLLLTVAAVAALAYVVIGHGTHRAQSTTDASFLVSDASIKPPVGDQVATISGGCFWAMQAMFSRLKGVDKIEAGYSGGHTANPTYEDVCTENTGYAETVNIAFDPKVLTYKDLLIIFFHAHNPTTLNLQGEDAGTSYRSAIFYRDDAQKATAVAVIGQIDKQHLWPDPIVTEVTPFTKFYRAEEYHQDYFAHNPDTGYCQGVVAPKVAKFRKEYADRLKPGA